MGKGDKEDKSFARKLKSHVEKCNKHTFSVTIRDGHVMVMMGDSKILKFIKSEAKNITVHDLLKKIHDDHQDNAEESAELKYSEEIFPVFPKLSCPFKSKRWTWDVARKELQSYIHVLGFGYGSEKKYGREEDQPLGWPKHLSWTERRADQTMQ